MDVLTFPGQKVSKTNGRSFNPCLFFNESSIILQRIFNDQEKGIETLVVYILPGRVQKRIKSGEKCA